MVPSTPKISPPPFTPKINANVLKLYQIWWFHHKNGKNSKFLHALLTFFYFLHAPPHDIGAATEY